MIPGLVPPVVPLVLSRDREGHVKQKVSRREHPLLLDVMLCVGVILPDIVDDDDDDDDEYGEDAIVDVSPSDCLLSLSPALSSSMWTGEKHDKLMRSFASRRTSLLLPSM